MRPSSAGAWCGIANSANWRVPSTASQVLNDSWRCAKMSHMLKRRCLVLIVVVVLAAGSVAQVHPPQRATPLSGSTLARMDRDLLEVTIPRLEQLYASHKYTVTQVVQWYAARIAKYNGIYRAV